MMMWGYGPSWGWMGLVMMAAQILFWGLLIWFGVTFFRRSSGYTQSEPIQNNALNILRERYARGEIDTEEFNRRKEDLLR
jgi:putative membrane protein